MLRRLFICRKFTFKLRHMLSFLLCISPDVSLQYTKFAMIIFRDCLAQTIRNSEDPEVQCPHTDGNVNCMQVITAQEIAAVSSKTQFSLRKLRVDWCQFWKL